VAQRLACVARSRRVFSIATRWSVQVLRQLAGLHERNIVHRDVKPANIMISGNDVVLGDVGIGRTLLRPTTLQTRAFVGTQGYAAPEQELANHHRTQAGVDHRADIYAVGVILHELVTGIRGSYAVNRCSDPRLRGVFYRMLAFERNQRFASATQAANMISRFING
jgi:serine/threonine protein kinase